MESLGGPVKSPKGVVDLLVPPWTALTRLVEPGTYPEMSSEARHQSCLVVKDQRVYVATLGDRADHGRTKDGLPGCMPDTVSAQRIEAQGRGSTSQPSGSPQWIRDSGMGWEQPARPTQFRKLIHNQMALRDQGLGRASNREKPPAVGPAWKQEQPSGRNRFNPGAVGSRRRVQSYRGGSSHSAAKMVLGGGGCARMRSDYSPLGLPRHLFDARDRSQLDPIEQPLFRKNHRGVRDRDRCAALNPSYHPPVNSMATLKQVASFEDILKDLLGRLPEHEGGQSGPVNLLDD